MPIAAVLLDLGFAPDVVKAVPILARTAEPARAPRRGAGAAARLRAGRARPRRRSTYERSDARARRRGAARGTEQLALDDAAYRTQLAYLFERSAFYRAKLDAQGRLGEALAASRRSRELPLTEKHELRATLHAGQPVRRAPLRDAGGDRPDLLDERHDGRAELRPAHRRRPRQLGHRLGAELRRLRASPRASASCRTYNAGPFVAGAALASFERIGLTHVPVGTGNTERLLPRSSCCSPDAVVLTPSYAAHLVEWAAERGVDLRGSSVERVLVAGEPGGGEPAFRAKLEEGWGAQVTEAMGIGDIGVSLWGECEEQDGMHLGARGFVHAELIDPETGARAAAGRRRHRRARAHASPAPRCAAAALPHARPRRRCARARARAAARARASAASAAPTTC